MVVLNEGWWNSVSGSIGVVVCDLIVMNVSVVSVVSVKLLVMIRCVKLSGCYLIMVLVSVVSIVIVMNWLCGLSEWVECVGVVCLWCVGIYVNVVVSFVVYSGRFMRKMLC